MTALPVLISIPHGGTEIPEEVRELTLLNTEAILEDIDVFTQDIYHIGDVRAVIMTPIARTFVDLNRAPDNLPPQNPDGVVKTRTAKLEPIYRDENLPDELIEYLIRRYHKPYHRRIEEILRNDNIRLALDCHSMSSTAPPISKYYGRSRPTVCLGNAHGKAASDEMVSILADCFREVFELDQDEVKINDPFAGGYITRNYGNNPVPWIQIEMNRKLYCEENHNLDTLMVRKRIKLLNELFQITLSLFAESILN